jgi:hypothetical protein
LEEPVEPVLPVQIFFRICSEGVSREEKLNTSLILQAGAYGLYRTQFADYTAVCARFTVPVRRVALELFCRVVLCRLVFSNGLLDRCRARRY